MMLCKRKGMERKRKGREEKKERGLWPPTVEEVRKPEVHQLDGLWKEGHGHSNCNVEEPTRIVNRGRLLMKIHMKCLRARELRARGKNLCSIVSVQRWPFKLGFFDLRDPAGTAVYKGRFSQDRLINEGL